MTIVLIEVLDHITIGIMIIIEVIDIIITNVQDIHIQIIKLLQVDQIDISQELTIIQI